MFRYLISYDLRLGATPEDYARIAGAIERLGGRRALLSQWALRSNSGAAALAATLWAYMDANDRLLVTELTDNWASYNLMIDLNTA